MEIRFILTRKKHFNGTFDKELQNKIHRSITTCNFPTQRYLQAHTPSSISCNPEDTCTIAENCWTASINISKMDNGEMSSIYLQDKVLDKVHLKIDVCVCLIHSERMY